jgi:hypothetical protein
VFNDPSQAMRPSGAISLRVGGNQRRLPARLGKLALREDPDFLTIQMTEGATVSISSLRALGSRFRYWGIDSFRRPDWGFRVVCEIPAANDAPAAAAKGSL